jgi:hypothetical protein
MSFQITEAFVQQYSANVFHLSQQKGSRLRGLVRSEMQVGKSAFYDRIGSVSAVKKIGRHTNTPQLDTPHSRRRVTLNDYEWADLIDKEDKIRMLNDPQSDYAMAAMWALGRSMDDEIIAALGGNSYAGEDGSTTVAFPMAQRYAANNGATFTNLNTISLRGIKKMFDASDIDESIPRHFAITSSQLHSLLGQLEVTNVDYASVKALVDGQVDSFMGFKFVRTERLPVVLASEGLDGNPADGSVAAGVSDLTGFRKCYAWAQDGALLAIGQDMMGKIDPRPDKSYATQVYACMSLGATRMEEEKVVEVICKES